MSKPRRLSLADKLGQKDHVITSSRDHVIDPDVVTPPEPIEDVPATIQEPSTPQKVAQTKASKPAALEPKVLRRDSYHTTLYLPEEAQFALREIAHAMRKARPHDVMLEAMADLFEKYNKGDLARECRARISQKARSRDHVTSSK